MGGVAVSCLATHSSFLAWRILWTEEPGGLQSPDYSQFSSVQLLSWVQRLVTPWTAACQASLSITSSQSLLKLMSVESVMPFNHLILCRPLLLLPSVFPSIRVFSSLKGGLLSLCSCSVVSDSCDPMDCSPPGSSVHGIFQTRVLEWVAIAFSQASLSITNSWSLLKLMSIESVMPSNHLILCRPLLLLPSVFPSIRVFSSESVLQPTMSQPATSQ